MDSKKSYPENDAPAHRLERRSFLKQASLVVAGVQAGAIFRFASRNSAAATLSSITGAVVRGSEAVA